MSDHKLLDIAKWKWGFIHAVALIMAVFYLLYYATLRIATNNEHLFPKQIAPGRNVIYAFWHSKTFALLPFFRGMAIGVLTLRDLKNTIYEKLCTFYGYQTVPISNLPKAISRLKTMLLNGSSIGLAVDGPRGPAGVIKPGVLYLAKETNKPIVIINVQVRRSFRLKSRWDKFEIPFPFTEVAVSMSGPLQVNENNVEETEKRLSMFLKEF